MTDSENNSREELLKKGARSVVDIEVAREKLIAARKRFAQIRELQQQGVPADQKEALEEEITDLFDIIRDTTNEIGDQEEEYDQIHRLIHKAKR